jgi:murein DD-endopeptidase MepM/ murein hydrolase activator NlpD
MNEDALVQLKEAQANYHSVVPFNASKDRLIKFDLTENNKSLKEEVYNDIALFTTYVHDELEKHKARYGIGGYGELRKLYSRSAVFDGDSGEGPRRLHIGTDIWGKPYTPVMAPYDAIVHSSAFNNQPGDYGATVILTHHLPNLSFYTLYGHLSLNSIKNLHSGDRIERGDIFAEFGIPIENGHWPPHLHFQLILDIGNWNGDYPGVCRFSEKEQWLENCPDPDIILQMNKHIQA